MGSLSGIDSQCLRQAERTGLAGTFRAFLSNKLQHIYTIVPRQYRDLPVANLRVSCTDYSEKWDQKLYFCIENKLTYDLLELEISRRSCKDFIENNALFVGRVHAINL